jgi:hypothetical protein
MIVSGKPGKPEKKFGPAAGRAGAPVRDFGTLSQAAETALDESLGYLNFSGGSADPRFLANFNELFGVVSTGQPPGQPWEALRRLLGDRLADLRGRSAPFADTTQAEAVLSLAFDHLLPAYRHYHSDLLQHQSAAALFQPFFLGRACAAVVRQGPPWNEQERIVAGALDELNDFLGYRPVAVLHTPQKIEPYPNEWVAPLPLFIRGAGVVFGPYHALIEQALSILAHTPSEILRQAWFEPALLDELALDPRAYDFDHPVNKRPNHQFGQWDPHQLDLEGRYRRFVLQGVTLEAIWQRTQGASSLPADERLFEAGAVLAGVILMAAAVGGQSPETHDSGVTLAKLLPRIAACRDQFYAHLLSTAAGPHGERLRAEASTLRQPFGGARQDLNQRMARLRATQLQHVHLAQLFARMGFPRASSRQASIVPVASARMICEISGRLTGGHLELERGNVDEAAKRLPEVADLLERAIQCGALVDPWNILGFQGQFSLFPSLENSVRDHRVDVLVHLVREIFRLAARLEGEAAAAGSTRLEQVIRSELEQLAQWWDQFATTEVSGVEGLSGRNATVSAREVAAALGAWHRAGEAAGDIAFWRQHVARFHSPKAYALAVGALLDKPDYVASRALLTQWLSQSEHMPLAAGGYSFQALALRWMSELLGGCPRAERRGSSRAVCADNQSWQQAAKFFDYLEANADVFWEVPRFEWGRAAEAAPDPDAEEAHDLFSAAYDEVTYRDSTDDNVEGETLEGGPPASDFELDAEATRIGNRLAFLQALARLWMIAAARTAHLADGHERQGVLANWCSQAMHNREKLLELLENIQRFSLPPPTGTHESLVEYDRRRLLKESLLTQTIATAVEASAAARLLMALGGQEAPPTGCPAWYAKAIPALRAIWRAEPEALRAVFPALRQALQQQPVLYVPLSKHGDPRKIFEAQEVQQLLLWFARTLPRLGLLQETLEIIDTSQAMERHRPDGDGVVTEFDRLFEAGLLAIVECLVDASAELDATDPPRHDPELTAALEIVNDVLLKRWLEHSRSLRLSVLEKVSDKQRWQSLVAFIERYGHELFTPRFLNLGNLRAILHQGVEAYLRQLKDRGPEPGEEPPLLVRELGAELPWPAAVEQLGLVIEAIVENYGEYKDFNSTTTQSDRGELLYVLLDFLRLKASYDRFAWNLRPLVVAHEALARRGPTSAAELWRQAIAERTDEVAQRHLQKLDELVRRHGARLPTVADRLHERFLKPLAIDRVRARIGPAMQDARRGSSSGAFELLEQELAEFAENPTGAGLDVPAWISALEQEADRVASARFAAEINEQPAIAPQRLTWRQVHQQLRAWESQEDPGGK